MALAIKKKHRPIYALKSWRMMSKLTTSEAAMLLGTDGSTFRRWETGERKVPEHYVARLRELSGLSRQVLLHERGGRNFAIIPFRKPRGGREAFLKMVGEMNIVGALAPEGEEDPRVLACQAVKSALGTMAKIGELVGVTAQAVSAWRIIPVKHVRLISDVTGIPPSTLRPDFFRNEPQVLSIDGKSEAVPAELQQGGQVEHPMESEVRPKCTEALQTDQPGTREQTASIDQDVEEIGVTFEIAGMSARLKIVGDISGILSKALANAQLGNAFSAHTLTKTNGLGKLAPQ
jgi:transcriptional regulator with XRE-family HTH domain